MYNIPVYYLVININHYSDNLTGFMGFAVF